MSYFNYHSTVKKKILQSQNVQMSIVDKYKEIKPCLVVQTDFGCYPIRAHRWQEYFELAEKLELKIEDKRQW